MKLGEIFLLSVIVSELRDTADAIRKGIVTPSDAPDGFSNWFSIEFSATDASKVIAVKPTDRFRNLCSAIDTLSSEYDLIHGAIGSGRAERIPHVQSL